MTPEEMLDDVLSALDDASGPDEAWSIMQGINRDFIRFPGAGEALATRVLSYTDADDGAAQRAFVALTSLLTEARMDRDNNGGAGSAFLNELESSLSEALVADDEGQLSADSSAIVATVRCYSQAGLPTPTAIA